jgi:hypothetical protein
MTNMRRVAMLLLSLALASLPGCAEELGPEEMPVTKVKGRVTEAGRPVNKGWIEFYPVDGTIGKIRSARLAEDGSFEADGVAVGVNLIRLQTREILSSTTEKRMFGAYSSPIRRKISQEPAGPISIDLIEEATRHRLATAKHKKSYSPIAGISQ